MLTGTWHSVGFFFDTDSNDLLTYARTHLAPLIGAGGDQVAAVQSTLAWVDGQPWTRHHWQVSGAPWVRVDRDLYVSGRELRWFRVDDLRDLVLQVKFPEARRVEAIGTFFFRLGNTEWTDRLRRWKLGRRVAQFRQRRFPTLVSYLVHYPLWWIVETTRGWHPIHAAAVSTPEGGILLAGASGAGKSTLAVALAAESGNRLLSDSFVVHAGATAFSVPEPILLDQAARTWLASRAEIVTTFPYPYMLERVGHHVRAEKSAPMTEARLLLFPQRGPQWRCAPLSSQQAWRRLSAANLMVNDLRRYFALAATWEQVSPQGLVLSREQNIRALAEAVSSYELQVPLGMTCDEAVERVMTLLQTVPQKHVLRGAQECAC